MQVQLYINNGQDLVHQLQTVVDTSHGASNISRHLPRQEPVEGHIRLYLATGSVQKGSCKHVHALHICAWFCSAGIRVALRRQGKGSSSVLSSRGGRGSMRSRGAGAIAIQIRQGLPTARRALLLLGIMQLPSHSVEQTDEAGLADPAAEQGICGESSKCIVADLGIRG
jgi:hypothetical protein